MSQTRRMSLRLRRLPDRFWDELMQAPWRYDLFQLLRRIDAHGVG